MTTDPVQHLADVVNRYTAVYRKGSGIRVKDLDGLTVAYIDDFPATPDRGVLVDVHFVMVGFTEAAADQDVFTAAVLDALGQPGAFGTAITRDEMVHGPSYIALGGWLGDQTTALRFIALGDHYGLWDVLTPARLGFTGADADQLAGIGLVYPYPNQRTRDVFQAQGATP